MPTHCLYDRTSTEIMPERVEKFLKDHYSNKLQCEKPTTLDNNLLKASIKADPCQITKI